jgi:hypothetical protein
MDNRIGSVWGDGRLPNRGREGVTMGRMKTVAYARGSERGCYRAATVRESVRWQSIVDQRLKRSDHGPAAHQW